MRGKKNPNEKKSKITAKPKGGILRRILRKKSAAKQESISQKKDAVAKRAGRRAPRRSAKAANFYSAQQEVSSAKYYMGEKTFEETRPQPQTEPAYGQLPQRYDEDKIVLQVRDPWWIHTYWEIRPSSVDNVRNQLGDELQGAQAILRVYDVSHIIFNGNNAHRYFDIDIQLDTNNWYIDTGGPGRSWCVDIGFRLPSGRFIMLARSNCVTTPLDGPSWITDEEWMVPNDMFARLYGMGFGFGPGSPGKGWSERLKMPFAGFISSPGLFSVSSPRRALAPLRGKKGFWLNVNTELIVYGATEPDAKVTVSGKTVQLNPDGTFSLRFALPDGKQTIAIEAKSSDETDYRSVTPVVSRETHQNSQAISRIT